MKCWAEHGAGLLQPWCWAASRAELAPAVPAWSMGRRPLHLPAPTCLKLATIWFSALIPADCSDLFKVFGVLVGGGRRGTAARSPKE